MKHIPLKQHESLPNLDNKWCFCHTNLSTKYRVLNFGKVGTWNEI